MERHHVPGLEVPKELKCQFCTKIIHIFNIITIKTSASFTDIDKVIQKCIWKGLRTRGIWTIKRRKG